ncbi:MAG: 2'-deoxycytidine 5'-triphosphate deaminase [Parcubacteria group bacterium]|nr:2'-deoxycytidine 5'-triphosphate deaminase [Parcubacteria group bacterium]
MSLGVYPSQFIEEMISLGFVRNASLHHLQPSSLDLSLSEEIYEIKGISLPKPHESIRDMLIKLEAKKFSFDIPLRCQKVYAIRLNESLALPKHIYAYCSNRSSSGRINLQARLIADGITSFDHVPRGYSGELWIIVSPQSFNVKLACNSRLNQILFRNSATPLSQSDYSILCEQTPLLYSPHETVIPCMEAFSPRADGLTLTINLDLDIVGYKCEPSGEKTLDFQSFDHAPDDFFEPIYGNEKKETMLKKNEFYILSTYEYIRVPNDFSMEMKPYDPSQGEFRTHFAGFFDPGFGYGNNTLKGNPAVLEIIPQDNDFYLYHRQPICTITYERLVSIPTIVYGSNQAGSHYQSQRGPKLSRHFQKSAKR